MREANLMFDMEGAQMARDIISASFYQAKFFWEQSLKSNDLKLRQYWTERLAHLMGELNSIDRIILQLQNHESENKA